MKKNGQRPPRRKISATEVARVASNTINEMRVGWVDPEKEKEAASIAQKAGLARVPDVYRLTRGESRSIEMSSARLNMERTIIGAIRRFEADWCLRVTAVEIHRDAGVIVTRTLTQVEMPRAGE